MTRPEAMLLLGPTGSGKTPLGEALARRGLGGRRCVHFDFGAAMRRAVVAERPPAGLRADDVAFLRRVLETGALLKDEHFPIAGKLLRAFLAERAAAGGCLVVLNGLPRHVGQARDVEAIVAVRAVVELAADADTVARRIATNAGGDRAGRRDDDADSIRAKLALYAARTAPLLDHYRLLGVPVCRMTVAPATTAEELAGRIEAWGAQALERRAGAGYSPG